MRLLQGGAESELPPPPPPQQQQNYNYKDNNNSKSSCLVRDVAANDKKRKAPENNATQTATKIEQVFYFELVLLKFLGGFMFFSCGKSPIETTKKLCFLLYRLLLIAFARFGADQIYSVHERKLLINLHKQAEWRVNLHFILTNLCDGLALIAIITTGLRSQNLLAIILRKQFDKRYLTGGGSGGKAKQSSKRQVSRVTLTRLLMLTNLTISTCTGLLREHQQFHENGHLPQTGNSTAAAKPSGGAASKLIVKLLYNCLFAALNVCQPYGQVFVALMIVAITTDMLRNSRLFYEQNQFPDEEDERQVAARLGPAAKISGKQTTKLLVQVRDVLFALRTATSLDYLALLVSDLSRLIASFSILNLFAQTQATDSILIAALEYVRIIFAMLTTRIGLYWLHMEIQHLRVLKERQLLDLSGNNNSAAAASSSSLECNNLLRERGREHATISASSSEPFQRDENNRERRADSFCAKSRRVETISCLRLAREIEHFWPTDWFTPDLGSLVSQNLLVITLVATLQQLAEASSRYELSVRTAGGG